MGTTDGGAPYAWDEAAAFHIGNKDCAKDRTSADCNLYSPYEFNWKRDLDFPDGTDTHTEAPKIFNFGLLNLRGDGYNAVNADKAQTAVYKLYAIAAIRSAIKYSKKAASDGKYVAEGWAYWRSGSGYIAQISADTKKTVQEIDELFKLSQDKMPATAYCDVKAKVESLYSAIGIDCKMVGTWKDHDEKADGLCNVCSGGASGGALHSGSTAYVDMCKAPASTTPGGDASGATSAAAQSILLAVAALL